MAANLTLWATLCPTLLSALGLNVGLEAESRLGLVAAEADSPSAPGVELFVLPSTSLQSSANDIELEGRYLPRLFVPVAHPRGDRVLLLHRGSARARLQLSPGMTLNATASGAFGDLDFSSTTEYLAQADTLDVSVPGDDTTHFENAAAELSVAWSMHPRWTWTSELGAEWLVIGQDSNARQTINWANRARYAFDRLTELGIDLEVDRIALIERKSFLGFTVATTMQRSLNRRNTLQTLLGAHTAWPRTHDGRTLSPRILAVAALELESVWPITPSKRLNLTGGAELGPDVDPAFATLDHHVSLIGEAALVLSRSLVIEASARWRTLLRTREGRWQPARPGQTQQVSHLRIAARYRLSSYLSVHFGLQGSSTQRVLREADERANDSTYRNELLVFASIAASLDLITPAAAQRTPDEP